MSDFRVLSLFDDEAVSVAGGRLQWVPLRRRLGIAAFGTNAYRADHAQDAVIEEHVESPGQQELYVVVRGRAEFTVGDETVDAPAGAAVFVEDPGVRRSAVALEEDTVVLAVGGWAGRAYHSLPWEPLYLAQPFMRSGDWAGAAETIEREAGEHIDTAILQFRLACCHARLGENEKALEEVRRAIEIRPGMRDLAESEEALAPLRGLAGWPVAAAPD